MKFEGPKHIKNAILSGNKEMLSAAGKKGARIAADNRKIEKIMSDRIKELVALEEAELRKSTNEHILDVDGIDVDNNS